MAHVLRDRLSDLWWGMICNQQCVCVCVCVCVCDCTAREIMLVNTICYNLHDTLVNWYIH